jgi:predicted cupin superfamily sugar epimerase
MKKIQQLIQKYNMQKHPEGGYYCQTYINDEQVDGKSLATSIYFLLGEDDASRYHKLQSDEVWYYHEGGSLLISMITPDGSYQEVLLGTADNAVHQYTVPKGTIFGSVVKDGSYVLVGCMVSHGFSFEEFELFDYKVLQRTYPKASKNLFHI